MPRQRSEDDPAPRDPYAASPAVISDEPSPDTSPLAAIDKATGFRPLLKASWRLWVGGLIAGFLAQLVPAIGDLAIYILTGSDIVWYEDVTVFAMTLPIWAVADVACLTYLEARSERGRFAIPLSLVSVLKPLRIWRMFVIKLVLIGFAVGAIMWPVLVGAEFWQSAVGRPIALIFMIAGAVSALWLWTTTIPARSLIVFENMRLVPAILRSFRLVWKRTFRLAITTLFVLTICILIQAAGSESEVIWNLWVKADSIDDVMAGSIEMLIVALAGTFLCAYYLAVYRALSLTEKSPGRGGTRPVENGSGGSSEIR